MWILPSRWRVANCKRFFAQWKAMKSSTPGVLVVDEDDDVEGYKKVELPDNWSLVVYPRMSMCGKSNQAFFDNPGKDWYGFIDDDAFPMTEEWDKKLIEAAGNNGLSHCWNGIGNERLASQFVIGGDLARELGWIFLPGLGRIYGDDVITAIADKKGVRKYLPDVKLEQRHFSNGKAPMDRAYQKPEAQQDREVYEQWLKSFV